MNTVEFLTEMHRMCKSCTDCDHCKLKEAECKYCFAIKTNKQAEEAIKIVEEWSKKHPKKTRASKFLKAYPNAAITKFDSYPVIQPCELDSTLHAHTRCDAVGCTECRERYWTEEVK